MNIPTHTTTPRWPIGSCVGARGFTLMELVVASALMATLMLGLWGLVNIFTSLANKGTDQLQRIRNTTQFFQWLESDLRRVPETTVQGASPALLGSESTLDLSHVASPPLEWLGRAEQEAAYQEGFARQTSGARTPAAAAGQRPLAESALATTEATAAWPLVRRVRYQFQSLGQSTGDSTLGVNATVRGTQSEGMWRYDERSAAVDAQWFGAALQFTAVEAVRFSYYNGRRWAAHWNSAAQGGLPVAVRIEAWFAGGSALGSPFAETDLATGHQQPLVDELVADPSAADKTSSSWVEALAPFESRALPNRPADLTRWVALR